MGQRGSGAWSKDRVRLIELCAELDSFIQ